MSKEESNRLEKRIEEFSTIDTLQQFKEFISFMKRKNFYYKGKLDSELHSSLYDDLLSKRIDGRPFDVENLVTLSKATLNSMERKNISNSKNDLEILIGMEHNNIPTPLIYFSKNLLYEI